MPPPFPLLVVVLLLATTAASAAGPSGAAAAHAASSAAAAAAAPTPTTPPPPLGTNLAAVADWTAQYPFINHMRMARPWFSGTLDAWDDGRALALDGNMNVKALAPGQVARSIVFTGLPPDPTLAGKTFVVRYSGEGDLDYWNAGAVISRARGRDVVRLKSPGGNGVAEELALTLVLTRTNPKNPLRNVHLVPAQGGLCLSNPFATVADARACARGNARDFLSFENASVTGRATFMPEFLSSLRFYRVLRFMDWARTNNSPAVGWAERARPTHQFYSTDAGVPLEAMIDLAYTLGADAWLCVPHLADDGWAKGLGALLVARLSTAAASSKSRKPMSVYLEYSNEVWNGGFEQTQWARERGVASGLHLPEEDETLGMLRYYVTRASQVFGLVAAGAGRALTTTKRFSLVRVLSTQAAVPWFTQQMLTFKPGVADAVAIAPYFGLTLYSKEQAAEVLRLGVSGTLEWVATGDGGADASLLGTEGSLPSLEAVVREHKAEAAAGGVGRVIAYEGGQHFVAVGEAAAAGGAGNDGALDRLLDALNRDARIKAVYLDYLTRWHLASGGDLFVHYLACDRWSEFGRWGAQEFPSQPRSAAPKLDALMTWAPWAG